MGDTIASRTREAARRAAPAGASAAGRTVVVSFLPGAEIAQVPAGTSLLDAATDAGVESRRPAAARAAAAAAGSRSPAKASSAATTAA